MKGTVAPRLPGKENPNLKTGAIEVRATELEVFNASPTPPFEMQGPEPNEELRLKYRFLDLRRPALQKVFILRHKMAQLMRQHDVEHELPRSRDAGPRPEHARRRSRLPRSQPRPRGAFLRPAAIAAIVQAIADGRRLRPLFPDRALLPRRRPPREPAAGIHPARRRDVVRSGRRRHDDDGTARRRDRQGVHRRGARAPACRGSIITT